ncbi:MAG: hypothetical protein OXF02_00690 [Simkaniaceae bacterium]|nr:hypothetical protein [Simkaniaceae bacterium]
MATDISPQTGVTVSKPVGARSTPCDSPFGKILSTEQKALEVARQRLATHNVCKGRDQHCERNDFFRAKDLIIWWVEDENEVDAIVNHGKGDVCAHCIHRKELLHDRWGDAMECHRRSPNRDMHALPVVVIPKAKRPGFLSSKHTVNTDHPDCHVCLCCIHSRQDVIRLLHNTCPGCSDETIPFAYTDNTGMEPYFEGAHGCGTCVDHNQHAHANRGDPEGGCLIGIGPGMDGTDNPLVPICTREEPITFAFLHRKHRGFEDALIPRLPGDKIARIQPHSHSIMMADGSWKEELCGPPRPYVIHELSANIPVAPEDRGRMRLHMCPSPQKECKETALYPDANIPVIRLQNEEALQAMMAKKGTNLCGLCIHNFNHFHLPHNPDTLCNAIPPSGIDIHAVPVLLMVNDEKKERELRGDGHTICRNCIHDQPNVVYMETPPICPPGTHEDYVTVLFLPNEEVKKIMTKTPGHHVCDTCAEWHNKHWHAVDAGDKKAWDDVVDLRESKDLCQDVDTIVVAFCSEKNRVEVVSRKIKLSLDMLRRLPHIHKETDLLTGTIKVFPCDKTPKEPQTLLYVSPRERRNRELVVKRMRELAEREARQYASAPANGKSGSPPPSSGEVPAPRKGENVSGKNPTPEPESVNGSASTSHPSGDVPPMSRGKEVAKTVDKACDAPSEASGKQGKGKKKKRKSGPLQTEKPPVRHAL